MAREMSNQPELAVTPAGRGTSTSLPWNLTLGLLLYDVLRGSCEGKAAWGANRYRTLQTTPPLSLASLLQSCRIVVSLFLVGSASIFPYFSSSLILGKGSSLVAPGL
ncbi:hypothetical protein KC335_g131 [Hortaea werneckii]|nr:hypothetical protein KC335_g131 [Hortaea werneckii]